MTYFFLQKQHMTVWRHHFRISRVIPLRLPLAPFACDVDVEDDVTIVNFLQLEIS